MYANRYLKYIEQACRQGDYKILKDYIGHIEHNYYLIKKKRNWFFQNEQNQITLPTRKLMLQYDSHQLLDKPINMNIQNLQYTSKFIRSKIDTTAMERYRIKSIKRPIFKEINTSEITQNANILNNETYMCIDTEFFTPQNKMYNNKDVMLNTYQFGIAYKCNESIESLLFENNYNIATEVEKILKENAISNIVYYSSSNDKKYCMNIMKYSECEIKYIDALPIVKKYFPDSISYNLQYICNCLAKNIDIEKMQWHQADQDAKALMYILLQIKTCVNQFTNKHK